MPEREEISRGLADQQTFTAIAARIGRNISMVSRGVARHGGRGHYRACHVHKAALRARIGAKERQLAVNDRLRDAVEGCLEKCHLGDVVEISERPVEGPTPESCPATGRATFCSARPAAAKSVGVLGGGYWR